MITSFINRLANIFCLDSYSKESLWKYFNNRWETLISFKTFICDITIIHFSCLWEYRNETKMRNFVFNHNQKINYFWEEYQLLNKKVQEITESLFIFNIFCFPLRFARFVRVGASLSIFHEWFINDEKKVLFHFTYIL